MHPLNVIDAMVDPFPVIDPIFILPDITKSVSMGQKYDEKYPVLQDYNPEEYRINFSATTSRYLLLTEGGSYTGWHIDYTGTSVRYEIVHGIKVFYFVLPTEHNLEMYRQHETEMKSHLQPVPKGKEFGDLEGLDGGVHTLTLSAGDVLYMPGGTMHSVSTPVDSIVFGSNFILKCRMGIVNECYWRERELKVHVLSMYPDIEVLVMLMLADALQDPCETPPHIVDILTKMTKNVNDLKSKIVPAKLREFLRKNVSFVGVLAFHRNVSVF